MERIKNKRLTAISCFILIVTTLLISSKFSNSKVNTYFMYAVNEYAVSNESLEQNKVWKAAIKIYPVIPASVKLYLAEKITTSEHINIVDNIIENTEVIDAEASNSYRNNMIDEAKKLVHQFKVIMIKDCTVLGLTICIWITSIIILIKSMIRIKHA